MAAEKATGVRATGVVVREKVVVVRARQSAAAATAEVLVAPGASVALAGCCSTPRPP